MIVVKVELHSAISGRVTELARMDICNDGRATLTNHRRANYIGRSYRGRDAATLDNRVVSKSAEIQNWPRLELHVWNLVRKMLENMGYTK